MAIWVAIIWTRIDDAAIDRRLDAVDHHPEEADPRQDAKDVAGVILVSAALTRNTSGRRRG